MEPKKFTSFPVFSGFKLQKRFLVIKKLLEKYQTLIVHGVCVFVH